jgi:hypothetical protein
LVDLTLPADSFEPGLSPHQDARCPAVGNTPQVHSALAKAGVLIPVSDLFGAEGRERLTQVPLGVAYAQRVISLLELIDVLDAHEGRFFDQIAAELRGHPGYRAIQALPGVGPPSVPSSSRRSGTYTASPTPATCVRGPV